MYQVTSCAENSRFGIYTRFGNQQVEEKGNFMELFPFNAATDKQQSNKENRVPFAQKSAKQCQTLQQQESRKSQLLPPPPRLTVDSFSGLSFFYTSSIWVPQSESQSQEDWSLLDYSASRQQQEMLSHANCLLIENVSPVCYEQLYDFLLTYASHKDILSSKEDGYLVLVVIFFHLQQADKCYSFLLSLLRDKSEFCQIQVSFCDEQMVSKLMETNNDIYICVSLLGPKNHLIIFDYMDVFESFGHVRYVEEKELLEDRLMLVIQYADTCDTLAAEQKLDGLCQQGITFKAALMSQPWYDSYSQESHVKKMDYGGQLTNRVQLCLPGQQRQINNPSTEVTNMGLITSVPIQPATTLPSTSSSSPSSPSSTPSSPRRLSLLSNCLENMLLFSTYKPAHGEITPTSSVSSSTLVSSTSSMADTMTPGSVFKSYQQNSSYHVSCLPDQPSCVQPGDDHYHDVLPPEAVFQKRQPHWFSSDCYLRQHPPTPSLVAVYAINATAPGDESTRFGYFPSLQSQRLPSSPPAYHISRELLTPWNVGYVTSCCGSLASSTVGLVGVGKGMTTADCTVGYYNQYPYASTHPNHTPSPCPPDSLPSSVSARSNQFTLDLDRISKGLDTRTTFMIRNIPNKYTQGMLLECIDATHKGTYDFLYLRIDFKNKCNVGYAFINFIDYRSVISFAQQRAGKTWNRFNSGKLLDLAYAAIQGKTNLVNKFRNSNVMAQEKAYRPKIFYSSGPHQGEEEPFPEPTIPGLLSISTKVDQNSA